MSHAMNSGADADADMVTVEQPGPRKHARARRTSRLPVGVKAVLWILIGMVGTIVIIGIWPLLVILGG